MLSLLASALALVPAGRGRVWSRRAVCAVPGAALAMPGAASADANSEMAALREELAALKALQVGAPKEAERAAAVAPPPPAYAAASEKVIVAEAAAPAGASAFDFDVQFRGEPRDIKPFLGKGASLFINPKFADPISLDQMPAIAAMADKYADKGLNVLLFPTNQGWFEGDDSNTLRLMFKQNFDFGRYPTSVVFDKMDLLGSQALPLYSYLTEALANPWGVNRIVFNYEKFLVDADGRPLRRYPRKFPVNFMESDVQAVLAGEPLPPPSEKYLQAWEDAKREAIKSEYAFKPGLNCAPSASELNPQHARSC